MLDFPTSSIQGFLARKANSLRVVDSYCIDKKDAIQDLDNISNDRQVTIEPLEDWNNLRNLISAGFFSQKQ